MGASGSMQCSIIIPFQRPNAYLEETLHHLDQQQGVTFEVILLPDEALEPGFVSRYGFACQIEPTGAVSPALKRDRGAQLSQSPILGFIDDDAYPPPDWLALLLPHFADPSVAAVGGPQLTPPDDGFWQQVSGASFITFLNGAEAYRYLCRDENVEVDIWPSVNFCVRKEDFLAVGGFNCAFWPGEDTKLCNDLVYVLGKKIINVGNVPVYHHRRAGFRAHMRQVGRYGYYRGFSVRQGDRGSLKLKYLLPLLFALFVLLGWLPSLWWSDYIVLWGGVWLTYGTILLLSALSVRQRGPTGWGVALMAQIYIACSHFWYGISYARGLLLSQQWQESLGR